MMLNQPETKVIEYKTPTWIKYVVAILLVLFLLAVIYILYTRPGSSDQEKYIRTEMEKIGVKIDSLKAEQRDLTAQSGQIAKDLEGIKNVRQDINAMIREQDEKLTTIKKEYEKINHYTTIPADSLYILFSKQFSDK